MEYSKITNVRNLIKKQYKNYLVGGFVVLVGVLLFGYMGLGWFGGSTQWLMVLHSGEAEITEIRGEAFLTISNVSRNTVFFSDRPDRKYQSIDTDEFIARWDTIFYDSPPNAAMVHTELGIDTEVIVVELFKPIVKGNEISFPIKIIGGEYTKDKIYTDVNLFIDSAWDDFVKYVSGSSPSPANPTFDDKTSTTDTEDAAKEVKVTLSGGHEIRSTDRGYPVDLIGGLLGITGNQARDSFYYLVLEEDEYEGLNYEDDVEGYRVSLLRQLGYLGITVDELDTATSYYQSTTGGVWSYVHADLKVTIENNEVIGFEIVDGGRGYTSQPTITVDGYGEIGVEVTISYTDDFETNGSLTSIRIRWSEINEEEVIEVLVPIKQAPIEIDYDGTQWR